MSDEDFDDLITVICVANGLVEVTGNQFVAKEGAKKIFNFTDNFRKAAYDAS